MKQASHLGTPTELPLESDEVSLVEMANAALRHWRLMVFLPVFLGLAAGIWSLTRDRDYAATGSFLPQTPEARSMGGAAALAQQFGMNIGMSGSGQSPEYYVSLLRSWSVLRQAVETEYEVPLDDGTTWRGNLIEFLEIEPGGPLPPWRTAMETLNDNLKTNAAWETGLVSFQVAAPHPVLVEGIAVRLLEILYEFNTELGQRRAQEEARFIGGRVAEAQTELVTAENALQEFLMQNREFRNSPELMFDHDRLQRQVLMRQEVYTSLLRSQEQVRIDGVRDTPVFSIVDHPAGTAEPLGRGTVVKAMLAFMLGLILASVIAFLRDFNRRSREQRDPEYEEFQGLARQAWEDLRNPQRWLSRGRKAVAAGE